MSFVPLLTHKDYRTFIDLLISFYRGKLYRDNYRYRFIAQPYKFGSNKNKPKCWVKNVIKKNLKLKVKVEVGLNFIYKLHL